MMHAWLDDGPGLHGWASAPAGLAGIVNDAVAFYFEDAAFAHAFVNRFYAVATASEARNRPVPALPFHGVADGASIAGSAQVYEGPKINCFDAEGAEEGASFRAPQLTGAERSSRLNIAVRSIAGP